MEIWSRTLLVTRIWLSFGELPSLNKVQELAVFLVLIGFQNIGFRNESLDIGLRWGWGSVQDSWFVKG